jgi:pimeloyl-ACP methyl ester carboxylesterase
MRVGRRFRRVAVGLVVSLVVGGLVVSALWAVQRRLIYFPDTAPPGPAARVIPSASDVSLRTADGLQLAAWLVPARPEADRGWAVLVLPGNGGNRADRAGLADLLSREGFSVLLVDYRGYGGNPGDPSEEGLAHDADAAASWLEEHGFDADRTIYLGESLGGGVAAALASRRPPAGLVLRSPFTSLADVGAHHYPWLPVRLLLRDRFPVLELVRELEVPVVVVRGTADEIVPPSMSARVAAAAPGLVEEQVLAGAAHNDPVMFGRPVAAAVTTLVEST